MTTLINITLTQGSETYHVEVGRAPGGGPGYQVLINNYYIGPIVKYDTGWTALLRPSVLTQDDIDGILEAVERENDLEN